MVELNYGNQDRIKYKQIRLWYDKNKRFEGPVVR